MNDRINQSVQPTENYDTVSRPKHYNQFDVQCVEFSRWMHGAQAQAFQYIWRCDAKHDDPTEDLQKAVWWLDDWLSNDTAGSIYPNRPEQAKTATCERADFDPGIHVLTSVAEHFDFCLGSALIAIRERDPERARHFVLRHLELRAKRNVPAVEAVPAGGAAGRQRRKS